MKRKLFLKRSQAFLTAALIGCFAFAGCSGPQNAQSSGTGSTAAVSKTAADQNSPAWEKDKDRASKLTWYVNADWWNTTYGDDPVTKKMKEDLNLDITFQTGDDTKLNGLFGSGQLPDLITVFDSQSQVAKKADTWALPLNDLADQYDPYFYKAAADETLKWYRMSDGKTYGYPSYSNTSEDYEKGYLQAGQFFAVRQDVYNAIGKPDMTTPDGFLNGLKAMKEKFPDLMPIGMRSFVGSAGTTSTSSIGSDLQDYLGVPISNKDGTYYNRNLDPEYLSWVKVLSKAYQAGCISDDTFSDDNTAFEEKVSSGKYGSVFISGAAQLSGALQKNISADPSRKYIAVDGPKSSLGNEPRLAQSGISGWSITYISKNCKDPQKAIELFTYLISDYGRNLCTFGIEGETYSVDQDGKEVLLPEVAKERDTNPDNYKKKYRLGEFCLFGHDSYTAEHGQDMTSEALKQMFEWGKGKVKPQFIIENIGPDVASPQARSLTNINAQWGTTLANLVRSKSDGDFDQTVNSYKAFLDSNDWNSIVGIYNEKMKANEQKLGITEFN